jgi:5-methyltetrahydrofolate--homocysteine methyltransferase
VEEHRKSNIPLLPVKSAIARRFVPKSLSYAPHRPLYKGRKVIKRIIIRNLLKFIDWGFFFKAWKLSARFASISSVIRNKAALAIWLKSFPEEEHEKAMEAAKLFFDARDMLRQWESECVSFVAAAYGVFSAWSADECIFISRIPFPMLRQQRTNENGNCLSLADFVLPQSDGKKDYIGAFAVSAGLGDAEQRLKKYEEEGDTYSALLMKTLLDRLAEAAAEYVHYRICISDWGLYSLPPMPARESLLQKESGIRPAIGYPSIPDQSINFLLHNELLRTQELGISLTENGVMYPNASVSGLIIAHPQARYFAVGKISEEQAAAYALRRGMPLAEMRKFLASVL